MTTVFKLLDKDGFLPIDHESAATPNEALILFGKKRGCQLRFCDDVSEADHFLEFLPVEGSFPASFERVPVRIIAGH